MPLSAGTLDLSIVNSNSNEQNGGTCTKNLKEASTSGKQAKSHPPDSNVKKGGTSGKSKKKSPKDKPANNDGASIDSTDIHAACTSGDLTAAKEAVSRNRLLLWSKDREGNLPLHLALHNGHNDVASYLIKEYPEGLSALNNSNFSPVHLALQQYQTALEENDKDQKFEGMLKIILKHQPKLTVSAEKRLTPLSYAASKGFVDLVGYMIEKDLVSEDNIKKDKSYPIHMACLGGYVTVLKKFHSKKTDLLSLRDDEEHTILHLAAKHKKLVNVAEYLLKLKEGQEMKKLKDAEGKIPSELARIYKNKLVQDLLEQEEKLHEKEKPESVKKLREKEKAEPVKKLGEKEKAEPVKELREKEKAEPVKKLREKENAVPVKKLREKEKA